MKRGFTILELLVASLLLGMLMTVLTMVFNQSSISWRVGQASIVDLDDSTTGISSVHDVADNLYVWNGKPYLLTSIWEEKDRSESKTLRESRPLAAESGGSSTRGSVSSLADETSAAFVTKFRSVGNAVQPIQDLKGGMPGSWATENIDSGTRGDPAKMYTVNVKSAGPNKTFGDYDDIWSFPDDFSL